MKQVPSPLMRYTRIFFPGSMIGHTGLLGACASHNEHVYQISRDCCRRRTHEQSCTSARMHMLHMWGHLVVGSAWAVGHGLS